MFRPMAKTVEFWPKWVETVSDMIAAETVVRAACEKCRTFFDVDLVALKVLKGGSYSLIDKYPRCKISACRGRCFFLYSSSSSTPLRPLVTDAARYMRMFGMQSTDDIEPPPDPPRPRPPAAQKGDKSRFSPDIERMLKDQRRRA